jgi:hypothetical protein
MRVDLWQHGRGGMCLLEELLMLLEQYGYDADSSSSGGDVSTALTGGRRHDPLVMSSRRSSVGSASSDRRPDRHLTHSYGPKSISYQQKLQQQQHEEHQSSSEQLPPDSLLKQQSILIQNHVLGLCKRFMKWLDGLEECVQEALKESISRTADRMRVGMIEQYRAFLKRFQREVAALAKLRALSSLPPSNRHTVAHLQRVAAGHAQQRRLVRGLQKTCLQVRVTWSNFYNASAAAIATTVTTMISLLLLLLLLLLQQRQLFHFYFQQLVRLLLTTNASPDYIKHIITNNYLLHRQSPATRPRAS